jgi:BirA family transcriptional regulator, biotin operon repressor / biotin---[acetyl-CoA-carboxylase] ligase
MERIEIESPFPGAAAFLVDRAISTQEDAKRLAVKGYPPGSLVAANDQSAGRGRFPERCWESEAGKNLLVSLYLGPQEKLPRAALPIRVGLALCEAVEDYASGIGAGFPSPPRLKWPNDLMLGDRKAAGILCESAASGTSAGASATQVFAGIGLNCNQIRFPDALAEKATSLALELGRKVDRWAILELFLARLAAGLGTGPEGLPEAGDWHKAATERLWRRGEAISFLPGVAARAERALPLLGILEGLDEEGSLLIRAKGEEAARAYAAGELTAAPPAYRVKS